jgi:Peptidase family M23.
MEEKKTSSRKFAFKRFFRKRWVYPAVYIIAAAILLTAFLWFQNRSESGKDQFGYTDHQDRRVNEGEALEVAKSLETFKWPVANPGGVEVITPFYDAASSEEEQEAAIIDFGNSYQPNTGIDIAARDGKSFDVLASMGGTVTRVEEDSFLGNVIVIKHADGIETRYQSVTDIQVQEGDTVKQGQVLAKAGRSLLNERAGIHTHFEIRKDNVPVNPLSYFERTLASLQKADVTKSDGTANDSRKDSGGTDHREEADEGENGNRESENTDE